MLHRDTDAKKTPYFIEAINAVSSGSVDFSNISPSSIRYNNLADDNTTRVEK
jgi:hypothetical protein